MFGWPDVLIFSRASTFLLYKYCKYLVQWNVCVGKFACLLTTTFVINDYAAEAVKIVQPLN